MGYGSYSHDAHVAVAAARQSARAEVFTQSACHPLMNPHGVKLRECRDSEPHPNSIGIVFALDVSGSMGEIPKELATHTLPAFMRTLLDAGVADPQILFMGIGCANGDRAPLQVGQFESTDRLMDQWLTSLYLEGGGGGGNESYELAMYFCARHTALDCFEKRKRRGYLFITGDEPPNPAVSRAQVHGLIGDVLPDDLPIRAVIDELQQRYEPFYLIPDAGRAANVERHWRDLLGDRVIAMATPDDTGFVAAGLVALLEGYATSLDQLVQRYTAAGLDPKRAAGVAKALTPFAASIGRDGAASPPLGSGGWPSGDGPSGYDR
ncbi:MAG: VWA domain-containing protein [Myxococcota bacterium]